MSHPIRPFMPTVFLPVSDLKRSIEWYCELLEIPVQPKQQGGGIYYFEMAGTDIILDSNMWGSPPMIMFDVTDIDAAYAFCQQQAYPITAEIQRFPDVSFFSVMSNMLCQAHRSPAPEHPKVAHPLLQRIRRVVIITEKRPETEAWYEGFLQRPVEADAMAEGLSMIRMDRGADLLIDDNRLSQAANVHYPQLQMDLFVDPIAIIESPDLEAARVHVLRQGATAVSAISTRLGLTFFTFHDPDGNGLMVCQAG